MRSTENESMGAGVEKEGKKEGKGNEVKGTEGQEGEIDEEARERER